MQARAHRVVHARTRAGRASAFAPLLVLGLSALALLPGCSLKRMAVNSVANSLAESSDVFASDPDPELVRDALPFGLKLLESLHEMVPENRGLLLAACRGFTQYSYAFVQMDADEAARSDRARAEAQRARALGFYLRARDYGLQGLELKHRRIGEELRMAPERAAAKLGKADLPLVFWTAAAWGAAINVARDRPELVADLVVVRALMQRALALDERYEAGAIHEALIALEALPAMMGGSFDRAREHFRRAVELSEGTRAAPFVMLAESVSISTQDRAEFQHTLEQALAIDLEKRPSARLENRLLQRRAQYLLERADELFLDAPDAATDTLTTEDSK